MTSLFPEFLPILRGLENAAAKVSEATLRLGTGLRVNRASDDPAGLALASKLDTDRRVYTQAKRNVSDGISFLNVADGGAAELKNILLRLREISTQASNGSYSSTQRQALDTEAQALVSEYNRIATTTEFNGMNVFDPPAPFTVQAGYGALGQLEVSLTSSVSTTVGDGTFQARVSYDGGDYPNYLKAADVNGDGKQDLVGTSQLDGQLNVFLGNGDGTFQARVSYDGGGVLRGVAMADLNSDGLLDAVTADVTYDKANVLLGNGDGSFQALVSYDAGTSGGSYLDVATADLNGDGKLDLVTASFDDDKLSVLFGNGDGTFQARVSYATGTGPFDVTTVDVNADGKLDLVSTSRLEGSLNVLLGNGDGTFQARVSYDAGGQPIDVALGDLNGDGKLDLVTASFDDDKVSVFLGNGDGTFQARLSYDGGAEAVSVTILDVNGDGKQDLVGTSQSDGRLNVFLGNGDGTFQARVSYEAGVPYSIATADFNGDGVKDVAGTGLADDKLNVFLANTTVSTTTAGVRALSGVSVATQAAALASQATLDTYLEEVEAVSGAIGASLSRFEIAAGHAERLADVYAVAEAQIRDADLAEETAKLIKNQVLQQVSAALLAQANLQPELVMKLLG